MEPPIPAVWWFALTITGLFSSFSFLTICFYAQGVSSAGRDGQVKLAAWRESGALLGVCLAAVAPTLLMGVSDRPFATFALGFAVFAVLAGIGMAGQWKGRIDQAPMGLREILSDPLARRLLILAAINATPVAVSSTLFLFFVESRLDAGGWEGGLLVLFFLSAALSAPVWSRLAERYTPKRMLLVAMVLAILSFGWALTLGAGDAAAFAIICVASGAATGADLTLLPALFARRMAEVSPNGGQGFGLWSLMNKLTLAVAAVALLPVLELAGFQAGPPSASPEAALDLLGWLYAGLPVALKCAAIALLLATDLSDPK